MNNTQEIWKVYKVSDPQDVMNKARWGKRVYEVSNEGNVKVNGVLQDFTKYKDNRRYLGCGAGYVHRMVAEAFIPNPDNKPEVDHINRNKHDNRACNLRWVTRKENAANKESIAGENNPMYGYVYSDEQRKEMSERNKKRMQDPNERKKCGRSGAAHHNYGKKLPKEQIEKQTASIHKFYEDPNNRKMMSDTMKEYYKTHETSIKKGSRLMTDGETKLYVHPDYWGEFIDIGFTFVRKDL